ncbi:MAG: phosphoribosyl-AMP cyclohydrolase [Candidatus Diapherotrites archaeon]|uniref:Phosphoribosyl-AMP cyclohydrolase n=1 Tax=Candidatus Iainarchaeum sp. TaxID=3101447 RepID=A0A938YN08_9ARCH|nr:phosphoribosyl-AMP cyclohydrolase [Candidatus Diapherotrites archaeon]
MAAEQSLNSFKALQKNLEGDVFIAAVDSWKGEVMVKGWKEKTGRKVIETVKELEPYCSEFLFTCIEREGMLQGTSMEKAKQVSEATSIRKSFAGGINSLEEAAELEVLGFDSVLGMAFYTGKISLKEIKKFNEVDFVKGKGLVPAIVQEARTGWVLMLAYMNRQSLDRTLKTGKATYWSRSRQCLWQKGATSGNCQKVKEIMFDCDRDAILLKVEQKGNACHTGKYSCFFNRRAIK